MVCGGAPPRISELRGSGALVRGRCGSSEVLGNGDREGGLRQCRDTAEKKDGRKERRRNQMQMHAFGNVGAYIDDDPSPCTSAVLFAQSPKSCDIHVSLICSRP
jgi:hypothetical protein